MMNHETTPFSSRVAETVVYLSDGSSAKEVARKMGITPGTVRNYIHEAKLIAGTRTTTGLVAKALRKGWIE